MSDQSNPVKGFKEALSEVGDFLDALHESLDVKNRVQDEALAAVAARVEELESARVVPAPEEVQEPEPTPDPEDEPVVAVPDPAPVPPIVPEPVQPPVVPVRGRIENPARMTAEDLRGPATMRGKATNGDHVDGNFRVYGLPAVVTEGCPWNPGSPLMTAFGATNFSADSTHESLLESEGSTWQGGADANCTSVWMPTLFDEDGNPVMGSGLLYYKYKFKDGQGPLQLPAGIVLKGGHGAGPLLNSTVTYRENAAWGGFDGSMIQDGDIPPGHLTRTKKGLSIPYIEPGKILRAAIGFPSQVAIDANGDPVLDSPNHTDHTLMPEHVWSGSQSHSKDAPIPTGHRDITHVQFFFDVVVPEGADTRNWRLSTDAEGEHGTSLYGGYIEAWKDGMVGQWHQGCILGKQNCSEGQTGDAQNQLRRISNVDGSIKNQKLDRALVLD